MRYRTAAAPAAAGMIARTMATNRPSSTASPPRLLSTVLALSAPPRTRLSARLANSRSPMRLPIS